MASAPRDHGPVADASRPAGEAAFADLYDRWSPLVYSLALRSLGDVAQAEEVTHDVFTQAWASSELAEPTRTRSDWLVDLACRGIAARAARDPRWARPDVDGSVNLDGSGGHESKIDILAERFIVADGIAHLDTSSQRVLRMALDRDLTLGAIAGRTGLRVEEVRSRIATALTELHEQLEGNADAHRA
ncbi:MAG TPA: sigma-70 family RNA polymerase sigma factor [Friedmanniella sp.]